MPKLPVVSSKEIIRIFLKIGFEYAPKRGKGSHFAFVKKNKGKARLVIVPDRAEIPKGDTSCHPGSGGSYEGRVYRIAEGLMADAGMDE